MKDNPPCYSSVLLKENPPWTRTWTSRDRLVFRQPSEGTASDVEHIFSFFHVIVVIIITNIALKLKYSVII